MTAGISLISGKTGAHRAPLQLLERSVAGSQFIKNSKFLHLLRFNMVV